MLTDRGQQDSGSTVVKESERNAISDCRASMMYSTEERMANARMAGRSIVK